MPDNIVELDMLGERVRGYSTTAFGESKAEAIRYGSQALKLSEYEILVANTKNKFVSLYDFKNRVEKWRYSSTHYIVSANRALSMDKDIYVRDDAPSSSEVFTRQNSTITWKNSSASPISIISGVADKDNFDKTLSIYGKTFNSGKLNPGETFSYAFTEVRDYPWFVYPCFFGGNIHVTRDYTTTFDEFVIMESDDLISPFTTRIVKLDSWGNVLWSFGEAYMTKNKVLQVLRDNKILIL